MTHTDKLDKAIYKGLSDRIKELEKQLAEARVDRVNELVIKRKVMEQLDGAEDRIIVLEQQLAEVRTGGCTCPPGFMEDHGNHCPVKLEQQLEQMREALALVYDGYLQPEGSTFDWAGWAEMTRKALSTPAQEGQGASGKVRK